MFKLAIWNAWILSITFCGLGAFFMGKNKNIAKRLADMDGYTTKEKFFTITASTLPYPFMILTAWTPFTSILPLLYLGISLYIIGMVLFAMSLKVIIQTPHDAPFCSGPYRFTRNPMYVAATIVFIGICFVTANMVLAVYLAVAVLLQHFMVLAEERICKEKFGMAYEDYLKRVPRYLVI